MDTTIKFLIDPEKLTLDALITMEEGMTNRQSRDLLASFVVNGKDEYMDEAEAQKLIGGLNLLQLKETSDMFVDECRRLSETIVPEAPSGN